MYGDGDGGGGEVGDGGGGGVGDGREICHMTLVGAGRWW